MKVKRLLPLLGLLIILHLSIGVLAEETTTYELGEKIRIDLGDAESYALIIQTPSETYVHKSSNRQFIFEPTETGNYQITIKVQDKKENINFNVIPQEKQKETGIQEQEKQTDNKKETLTEESSGKTIPPEGTTTLTEEHITIGKPVTWKQTLEGKGKEIKITIPKLAEDITIKSDEEQVPFEIKESLTNKVNNIIKEEDEKSVLIDATNAIIELEYTTPAPTKKETIINETRKIITVDSELHYEKVLVTTNLTKNIPLNRKDAVRVHWKEENKDLNYELKDNNNDSYYESIEWIAPHLSTQTFEIIIEITDAEHLDENYKLINNIYEEMKAIDGKGTEIQEGEIIRATFETALTWWNDITIYVKGEEGTSIEVYEKDGTTKITEFNNIEEEKLYKQLLTNYTGASQTFDLKIKGGTVWFDYIVDPSIKPIAYFAWESGGFEGWTDGGVDASISSAQTRCWDNGTLGGSWALQIQDNSPTSFSEEQFDLSPYEYVHVNFSAYYESIEGTEYLSFQCDGTELWTYAANTEGTEDQWLEGNADGQSIKIWPANCTFDASVTLRFEGEFSGNGDDVYIDCFNLTGYNNTGPTHTTPLLNSSQNLNRTNEDLTCFAQGLTDPDGYTNKLIYNWYKNDSFLELVNMPFEGGSNDTWTRDYSENGFNGTVGGATWNRTAGYDNYGTYIFDGVDDYINLGDIDELDQADYFTVSLWFYRELDRAGTSNDTNHFVNNVLLAQSSGSSNDNFELGSEGTDIELYFDAPGNYNLNYDAGIQDDRWYHIAVVFNSTDTTGEIRLYINGTEVNSWTDPTADLDSSGTTNFTVGLARPEANSWGDFYGMIDDLKVYNTTLTANQIQKLYDNRSGELHQNETRIGDSWVCEITPNDGVEDGPSLRSNSLLVLTATVAPAPQIIINHPLDGSEVADVTPLLNITTNESASAIWYTTDDGTTNITICSDSCVAGTYDTNYLFLEEQGYDVIVYANNSLGTNTSNKSSFTVNFNFSYYDTFNDNSSILRGIINNVTWNIGNITFTPIDPNDDTAAWDAYSQTGDTTFTASGRSDHSLRMIIRNASINTSADAMRMRWNSEDADLRLNRPSICQRFEDTSNCVGGTWQALTIGGSTTYLINSGEANWTDWINYPINASLDYLVSFYLDATNDGVGYLDSSTNDGYHVDNTDLSLTENWSASSPANEVFFYGVDLIELKTPETLHGNYTIFHANVSTTIVEFQNITWNEAGVNADSNITIEVSPDNGANWYEATNNEGLTGIGTGTGLAYRALFNTENTTDILSILDINITWTNAADAPPQIIINTPENSITTKDVSPTLNITLNDTATSLWYSINNGANVTICNQCSGTQTTYLYLEEGTYTVRVWSSNVLNAKNTNTTTFSIETEFHHNDTYLDNSSLLGGEINNVVWNEGNVTFTRDVEVQVINETFNSTSDWTFSGGTWTITSGRLHKTSNDADTTAIRNTFNMSADTHYNITFYSFDDDNDQTGVIFGYQSSGNYYRCLFDTGLEFSGGRLERIVGGVENQLATTTTTYTENTWSNYSALKQGNNLSCFINGVMVMSVTDSNWSTGQVGIFNEFHDEALYENFFVFEVPQILNGNFTAFEVNVTETIADITNVSWSETGTDTNRNISIEVSADYGASWANATNNQALTLASAGSSLIYRVFFKANDSTPFSLDDINISWSSVIPPPVQIIINEPILDSTQADVTPTLNITLNATAKELWYTTDNGATNNTICTSCTGTRIAYIPALEGSFTVNVYANNTADITSTNSTNFSIDMNNNYYDNFSDNSSLIHGELNGVVWNTGEVNFTAVLYEDGNTSWSGYQQTGDSTFTASGRSDHSFRMVIRNAFINTSGNAFRVRFNSEDSSLRINRPTICQRFGSTSDCVGGTFQNLTIQGSQTYLFSAGGQAEWTDWINYPIDSTADYLISFYLDSSDDGVGYLDSSANDGYHVDNTDLSQTQNWSGSSPANEAFFYSIDAIQVGATRSTQGNYTAYNINVTNPIKQIRNITWSEVGTNATNNMSVALSFDTGSTWQNVTSGLGLSGFSASNSMLYRVFFNATSAHPISITDINITWSSPPEITIHDPVAAIYPANRTRINVTIIPETGVSLDTCWYSLDLGASNTTFTCTTNVTGITSNEGENTWTVWANDTDGALGKANVTFTVDGTAPNITFINQTDENELLVNDSHPLEQGQNLTVRVNATDSALDSVWLVVWENVKGGATKLTTFFTYFAAGGWYVANIPTTYLDWQLPEYNFTIFANDTANLTSEIDGNFTVLNISSTLSLSPNPSPGTGNVTALGQINQSNGTVVANHPFNLWLDGELLLLENLTAVGSYTFNQSRIDNSTRDFRRGTFNNTEDNGDSIKLTTGNITGNYTHTVDAGALVEWTTFSWTATGQSCSGVMTWQEGINQFTGTTDTYIDSSNANVNYGQNTSMRTDTSPTYRSLLAFDVVGIGGGKIPFNSTISQANITLNVNDSGNTVTIYEILEEWSETQATYNNRLTGTTWGSAGLAGFPSRSTTSQSTFNPTSAGNYTFDITQAMRRWVNQTSTNYGVVLNPGGTNPVEIRTHEFNSIAHRPLLTVNFNSSDCTSTQAYIRTSPNGTEWSAWQPISNGGTINDVHRASRYLQYTIELNSFNSSHTPTLEDVTANYTSVVTDNNGEYAYNFSSPTGFGTYEIILNTSLRTMFTNASATLSVQSGVDPNITLVLPANATWLNTTGFNLTYNATDANGNLYNASLILNGIYNQSNTTPIIDNGLSNFTFVWNTQGLHNWTVNVSDDTGNYVVADPTRTFYLDLENPEVSQHFPANNSTYNLAEVNLTFNATDNLGSPLTCDVNLDGSIIHTGILATNNTLVNVSSGTVTSGTHYWNVTCRDNASRSFTSETWQFEIQDTPPTVYLFTPLNDYSDPDGNISFYFNVSDDNGMQNCTLIINSTHTYLNQSDVLDNIGELNVINLTDMAQGFYNWTVGCYDISASYHEPAVRNFTVDLVDPNVTLNAPANSSIVSTSNVNFNFTVTDAIDSSLSCDLTINNNIVDSFSAPNNTLTNRLISSLTDGLKWWNVTCTDDAGRTNTSVTWNTTVAEPPTIFLNTTNNSYYATGSVNLQYTPHDNTNLSNCSVYLNGAFNQSNTSAITNGALSTIEVNDQPDGIYDWYVQCEDFVPVNATSEIRRFYVDRIPPNVTLQSPDNISVFAENITFNFTVTDAIPTTLTCNLTVDESQELTNVAVTNNTLSSNDVEGITDGFHRWYVNCTDSSGNLGNSSVFNFTRVTAPNVTLVHPPTGGWFNYSPFNLTYAVQDDQGFIQSWLYINGSANRTNSTTIINAANNTFEINDLSDGYYNWTVIAQDLGGSNGTDTVRNFGLDRILPTISLHEPTAGAINISTNNVTFNWTPTDNLDPTLNCDLIIDGSTEFAGPVPNNTVQNVYQLLPDGLYIWNVTCTDDAGNNNFSDTRNFTVEAPPIVTLNAPADAARTGDSTFNVTYTPEDPLGITQCELYLDGVLNQTDTSINPNTQNNFTVFGISEGVHNWTVNCTDPDNNYHMPSTRDFVRDITGPVIVLNAPENNSGVDATENILFNWTATDNLDSILTCDLRVDGNVEVNNQLVTSGIAFATAVSGISQGQHDWNVTCWDTVVNNTNVSQLWRFNYTNSDFIVNSTSLIFSTLSPTENETIQINATVWNAGAINITEVNVTFYEGDPDTTGFQIGGTQTISINAYSSNIASINWNASLGTSNIFVRVDEPFASNGTYDELNETNNEANLTVTVSSWHFFYGAITSETNFTLEDSTEYIVTRWGTDNSTNGNIFATDYDASVSWTNIQAIGRDINGASTNPIYNDTEEIDDILNSTNFKDSINTTYMNGATFNETDNFTIFKTTINNVPIVTSINDTDFKTGILWDTSDDIAGDEQYDFNDTEDVIFITKVNHNTPGTYGITDYEMRVPALLRDYDTSDRLRAAFYIELY